MFSEDSLDILRLDLGVDSITDYHDRSKGARSYTAHSLQSEEAVFACPADVGTKLLF